MLSIPSSLLPLPLDRNNLESLIASAPIQPCLEGMITSAQSAATASEYATLLPPRAPLEAVAKLSAHRCPRRSLLLRSVYFQDQSKRIQNRMILL